VGVGAWLGSFPLCKVHASTVNTVSEVGASDLYVKWDFCGDFAR
jgi:hypothetical protein